MHIVDIADVERLANGHRYTSVGSYPLSAITHNGEILCPACVSEHRDRIVEAHRAHEATGALANSWDDGWLLVAIDVVWEYEGTPPTCDECECEIETAYGAVEVA